ncbi:MAG: glutamate 5-kinase [Verrucomicrobia bacterium]|nr:MAG: glutamate 5-kinase [Verrucomicrobiota bacterium]
MRHALLQNVKRLVVKLGTGILTNERHLPDPDRMRRLVDQIARQHGAGREVVLVSSGAVGAGMGALGLTKRPTDLAGLQSCAAVGQVRLMAAYDDLFAAHGIHIAQVLLTHEDLRHHDRHLNARNTLLALLRRRVIPIINENDTVSHTELKFGDNDRLSALVGALLPADLLVILTSADGLMTGYGTPEQQVVPLVERIDDSIRALAGGTNHAAAVGGMATKIEAARIATRSGFPVIIASGLRENTLDRAVAGEPEGTLFVPSPAKLRSRKRWIAFFHRPRGVLRVDDGARTALRDHGKSLLAPGIRRCEGRFQPGEVVSVCDLEGMEFARGIVRCSAQELNAGSPSRKVVIHRDDLVIL